MDINKQMFNRRESFYEANFVILVAFRSPKEYQCVVLPVPEAECAAQLALDRDCRKPIADGQSKKPSKVWVTLDSTLREKDVELRNQERESLGHTGITGMF